MEAPGDHQPRRPTPDAVEVGPPGPTRFGKRFVALTVLGVFYFAGLGMLAPVLPRYVVDELDGGGIEVGIVVGAFAFSALALRSWMGRIGDRRGRRVLAVGGCALIGVSVLLYGTTGLVGLILLRLVSGAGEAAAIVGAVTAGQDLAPPGRSGQAASFFSMALTLGMLSGVPLGEWLYHAHGVDAVWMAAGGACLLASGIGTLIPRWLPPAAEEDVDDERVGDTWLNRHLHPAAVRPGLVLACGVIGNAAFSSFVPLYVADIGLANAAPLFIESSGIVLFVRLVGNRLPDKLGIRRGPALALALKLIGMATMAAWGSPTGLYIATAVHAAGSSLLYPSLFPAVVAKSRPSQRSHALGTLILFYDLPLSVAPPFLGLLVEVSSKRSAFGAAACAAALGLVLHRRWFLVGDAADDVVPSYVVVPEPAGADPTTGGER